MCVSPIRLLSPRKNYEQGVDKQYLVVPCGHCVECIRKKADDWYVRCAYEYMRVTKIGGCVYFPTLSFNEEMLHRVDLQDKKYDGLRAECQKNGIPVPFYNDIGFDKDAVRDFNKRLRQYISQGSECIINIGIEHDVKYKFFCASEFGTNTKRPHNHLQLYFDEPVSDGYFDNFCHLLQLAWSVRQSYKSLPDELVKYLKQNEQGINYEFSSIGGNKCCLYTRDIFPHDIPWSCHYMILPPRKGQKKFQVFKMRGFVSWPKHKESGALRPKVEGIQGCRYVSKYITKQDAFEAKTTVKILRDFLSQIDRPYTGEFQEEIRELKTFLPFTLASREFGIDLEKELIAASSSDDELKKFLKNPVRIDGDYTPHEIPKYIVQRVFYQNIHYDDYCEMYNLRVLSDLGLRCLKLKFDCQIEHICDDLRLLFLSNYLDILPDDFFNSHELDIIEDCRQYCERVRLDFIAAYGIVFRDVDSRLYNDTFSLDSIDSVMNCVHDIFDYTVDLHSQYPTLFHGVITDDKSPKKMSDMKKHIIRTYLCNYIPVFSGAEYVFNNYLTIRNKVNEFYSSLKRDNEIKIALHRARLGLSY